MGGSFLRRAPLRIWAGDDLIYTSLGQTGLNVSAMCMGSLVMGPAQYNMSIEEGDSLIQHALDWGVNFFDTSEFYGAYPYLRCLSQKKNIIISSRSYAVSESQMKRSLEIARSELNRERIEIFGLHEQESGLTLKGHREALEYLAESREKGIIDAVSVSTHYVSCVRSAAMLPEIDVIFAILNMQGLGIADGSREDMEEALAFARYMGKGIYLMKALGGGHLYRQPFEALSYARDFPHKDSVCVGVKNEYELEFACKVLCSEISTEEIAEAYSISRSTPKRLVVEKWCEGCGKCADKCGFSAITIVNGKATIDESRCMLCGYCARVCPNFCIKVV